MKIVAVTACPTGIAHSYMAAEGLQKAAKKSGDEIQVEIQGSMGVENKLNQSKIDEADLVVLAIGVAISGMERFSEKKVSKISPHEVLSNSEAALERAKGEVV